MTMDANDIAQKHGFELLRKEWDLAQISKLPRVQDQEVPIEGRLRVRLVSFADIQLNRKRRFVVKDLIPATGLAVIWGPPKSGKSFWAFDLMMHVALGWDYRGQRVQQGAVIYCAFEGQSGVEARVEAFRQQHLSNEPDDVPFYLEPVTLDLVKDHPELISVVGNTLNEVKPAVVVLDTLNRSFCGSESSDQDMTAYVQAADAVREAFECTVLIIHHCGVDGSRPRGHTALTGAADCQIAVKREQSGIFQVVVEFMKDGPEGFSVASRLEQVEVGLDLDGESITSCVVFEAEAGPASGRKSLSGQARIAFEQLRDAIAAEGKRPPANNHIPADIRAVPLSLWRRYCYAASISATDTQVAKQKAFQRAGQKLQDSGLIGKWEDLVWLA